jgi:YgiT-type zinc finger domain-containing protein
MTNCALCNRKLQSGKVDHVISIGDEKVTVQVPALLCRDCNESFTEAHDLELAEGKVAVAIIQSGAATGARFRFLRRFLALSAKGVGELLKVVPETISRWETGAREIDPLAWFTLSTLVRDQINGREDAREMLLAMQHPKPLGQLVLT